MSKDIHQQPPTQKKNKPKTLLNIDTNALQCSDYEHDDDGDDDDDDNDDDDTQGVDVIHNKMPIRKGNQC